jgi:hypothetical protein
VINLKDAIGDLKQRRAALEWRVKKLNKAASKAHDPDFKRIWLKHAEDLRANYRKGLH